MNLIRFLKFMARIKKIGIYLVTSPTLRNYVGQSRDIHKRFIGYKNLHGCTRQTRLLRSLEKHGTDSHEYKILEECEIALLNERERYWQDFYYVCGKAGLNCRLTGVGEVPAMISEETRRRMSESGKKKILTEEHLNKLIQLAKSRKGSKGTPQTMEQRLATSKRNLESCQFKGSNNPMFNSKRFGNKNPFYNQKHTDESRRKISEKATGRVPGEEVRKIWSKNNSLGGNPAAKIVLDTESGIYYSCGKEAWLASNRKFVYSTFKSKLNGSNKYPLSFKYV